MVCHNKLLPVANSQTPHVCSQPTRTARIAVSAWLFAPSSTLPKPNERESQTRRPMDMKDFAAHVATNSCLNIDPTTATLAQSNRLISIFATRSKESGRRRQRADMDTSYFDPMRTRANLSPSEAWIERCSAIGSPSVRTSSPL